MLYSCEDYGSKRPTSVINTCPKLYITLFKKKNRKKVKQAFHMGKIFLQPTRSIEFISLDFAVTNAGNAFEQA